MMKIPFRQYLYYAYIAIFLVAITIGILSVELLDDIVINREVNQLAQDEIKLAVAVFEEVEQALTAANASPFEFCSPQDIDYLKVEFMESAYAKDIGRSIGNKLYCSSNLGALKEVYTTPVSPVEIKNNMQLYTEIPILVGALNPGLKLKRGKAEVVLDNSVFFNSGHKEITFLLGVFDNTEQLVTLASSNVKALQNRYGFNASPDTWSECDKHYRLCMLVDISPSRKAQIHMLVEWFCIFLSSLLAILLCMGINRYHLNLNSLSYQARKAIKNRDLNVVYQPIVDYKTRKIVAAEALVRWKNNDVSVENLIKIAEKEKFINEITTFVLRRVIKEFKSFLNIHQCLRISINISPTELDDEEIFTKLNKYWSTNINVNQLGIELTERDTTTLERITHALCRLHKLGYKVYIDDFGTGYSSLAQMASLDIDYVKLDQIFIKQLRKGIGEKSLLPEIVNIANRLHVDLIIEGVEYESDLIFFDNLTQNFLIQGWLFGRPVPAEQFKKLFNLSNAD